MKPAHQRLDELMRDRRFALGIRTWRALSERAGISYETLRAVRAGGNPGDATADGLERALRWKPGSIRAVLAGGEPTPRLPGDMTDAGRAEDELSVAREPTVAELAARVAELQATVDKLLGTNREDQGKAG